MSKSIPACKNCKNFIYSNWRCKINPISSTAFPNYVKGEIEIIGKYRSVYDARTTFCGDTGAYYKEKNIFEKIQFQWEKIVDALQ